MIAALLLMAAAPAHQQDCGDLPQQPMNMCLLEEFQRVDAELNRQWKFTADAIESAHVTELTSEVEIVAPEELQMSLNEKEVQQFLVKL